MDIPSQLRLKMGIYDIQIDGVTIKATLVEFKTSSCPHDFSSLETAISEFKTHIQTDLPVVGVDFKPFDETISDDDALLLLYTMDRCLVIKLHMLSYVPAILGQFLSDRSICFVGFKIDSHLCRLGSRESRYHYRSHYNHLTGKGAEVRSLAAAVLQNPQLTKCADVFELATKTGLIEMKRADEASKPSDWTAPFFSREEIKYAVHDAYYCHKIGNKLLGML